MENLLFLGVPILKDITVLNQIFIKYAVSLPDHLHFSLSVCNCMPNIRFYLKYFFRLGWSGGAMVLGKLPVPGRPTYLE